MNVTRHNSYFTFIWLNNSWTVRSNNSCSGLASQSVFNFNHIMLWDTISNYNYQFYFSLNSFKNGISCKCRGNINNWSFTLSDFFCFLTILKNWDSQMGCSCFFWVNSSNHFCFIFKSLLSMERPLISSNSLTNNSCMLINPYVGFSLCSISKTEFTDFS